MGIYTIPEMSAVGLTEAQARQQYGDAIITGSTSFGASSRGHIAAIEDGFLKLVGDPDGKLLGIHIIGEGAAELIAIGQMALLADWHIQGFIDTIYNFPHLAETYRIAALDALTVAPEVVATAGDLMPAGCTRCCKKPVSHHTAIRPTARRPVAQTLEHTVDVR